MDVNKTQVKMRNEHGYNHTSLQSGNLRKIESACCDGSKEVIQSMPRLTRIPAVTTQRQRGRSAASSGLRLTTDMPATTKAHVPEIILLL